MAGRPGAPARVTIPTPAAALVTRFQAAAVEWYAVHGRDLAFRRTSEPWAVLVSEVMAQQTQAGRAAEAWTGFMDRFPTPGALAATPVADVIRAWRGLGYNRRAVALRAAAVRIVEQHDGRVPDSLEALEALPGIGPYTARAVLAIAFARPVAALDTNMRRVLDRALGPLPTAPASRQSLADSLVPGGRSAEWTHALMDIGAALCRKREPRCSDCPLLEHCSWQGSMRPDVSTGKPAPRFESTSRWLRGRIIDRLREAPPAAWLTFDGPVGTHALDAVVRALDGLQRDGLLERSNEDPRQARLIGG